MISADLAEIDAFLDKAQDEISASLAELQNSRLDLNENHPPKRRRFQPRPPGRRSQTFDALRLEDSLGPLRNSACDMHRSFHSEARGARQDGGHYVNGLSGWPSESGGLSRRSSGLRADDAANSNLGTRSASVRHLPDFPSAYTRKARDPLPPSSFKYAQLLRPSQRSSSTFLMSESAPPGSAGMWRRGAASQSRLLDFGDPDAVTRWTSQILAEIESLPASRTDVNASQPSLLLQSAVGELSEVGTATSTTSLLLPQPPLARCVSLRQDLSGPTAFRPIARRRPGRAEAASSSDEDRATPTEAPVVRRRNPRRTRRRDARSLPPPASPTHPKSAAYNNNLGEKPLGMETTEAMIDSDSKDVCTQTTPLSLSRSSSFTWMSEGELGAYVPIPPTHGLDTPTGRLLASLPHGVRPPSDSSDEGSEGEGLGLCASGRSAFSAFRRSSDVLMLSEVASSDEERPALVPKTASEAFDESLQLLLQYTGNAPSTLPHQMARSLPPQSAPPLISKAKIELLHPSLPHTRPTALPPVSPRTPEPLYDNVRARQAAALPSSSIARDTSMASGMLGDSEWSPVSEGGSQGPDFADSAAPPPLAPKAPVLREDSSPTSSEGSFVVQPTPPAFGSQRSVLHGGLSYSSVGSLGRPSFAREPPPPSPRAASPLGASLPLLGRRAGSLERFRDPSSGERASFGGGVRRPATGSLRGRQAQLVSASQGNVHDAAPEASQFATIAKARLEAEVGECLKWLRAAGFPQYAQMFQDGEFPVSLAGAEGDHGFLSEDELRALFRRLDTLNRACASVDLPRRGSAEPGHLVSLRRPRQRCSSPSSSSSGEEDAVALSEAWRYQRKSKTWSRVVEAPLDSVHAMVAQGLPPQQAAPRPRFARHQSAAEAEESPESPSSPPSRLTRSQSERIKDQTRAFIRRMGFMRPGSRRKHPQDPSGRGELVIGSPVLMSHHSASPPQMRMFRGEDAPVVNRTGFDRSLSEDPRRHARIFPAGDPSEGEIVSSKRPSYPLDDNSNKLGGAYRGTGIRTNPAYGMAAEGGSPLVGRRGGSPADKGLVLYNPVFAQTGLGMEERRRRPNGAPTLESSPELGGSSLRVEVEGGGRANSSQSSDTDSPRYWERRDSGVGSSLSRSPSGPLKQRRWANGRRGLGTLEREEAVPMDTLSLPDLIALRKLSLLRLTALLERYAPSQRAFSPAVSSFSSVHKLFRRIKSPPEAKPKGGVFGVPLHVLAQRTGQPLPPPILQAMRFLRQQAPEALGLFRKSGLRSRILKLKAALDAGVDVLPFEPAQCFDVADLLKSFFRELPEPLLTIKLSDTLIAIQLHVPPALRLEAVQKTLLLLPDENREALQSLLAFLSDVAAFASANQMSGDNLAVCLAPSLFHLSPRLGALSPTRRHKTIAGGGLPSEKELRENSAAQACLALMIGQAGGLFTVPASMRELTAAKLGAGGPGVIPLSQVGSGGVAMAVLEDQIAAILKEHRERWKGWMTEGSLDGVEISAKKPLDAHPLKLWRAWTDVEAPPEEVLHRILRERDLWDEGVLKWRLLRKLGPAAELFQFVHNDMPPHPTRDYCLVRLWRSGVGSGGEGCVLAEASVGEAALLGGVSAHVLASRFLIEPSGAGRSRLTYVARVDTKGRGKGWYNKVFGHVCARQVADLRDSFRQSSGGPETKV